MRKDILFEEFKELVELNYHFDFEDEDEIVIKFTGADIKRLLNTLKIYEYSVLPRLPQYHQMNALIDEIVDITEAHPSQELFNKIFVAIGKYCSHLGNRNYENNLKGGIKMNKTDGWISVSDRLPKPFQTVWLTDGKGSIALGYLIETKEVWFWAKSNGTIYVKNGEIVSECLIDDLEVAYWHELPKVKFDKEN